MRRLSFGFAFTVASLALSPATPAGAQSTVGPAAGVWGAEASTTSGSLLRFRSAASAWILGYSTQFIRIEQETGGVGPDDQTLFTGNLSLGLRSYRRETERTRPFTTVSGIAGYTHAGGTGWRFGGAFEVGGAHFFTPHVSLGVATDFVAAYESQRRDLGGQRLTTTIITIRSGGFRLLGAVYF